MCLLDNSLVIDFSKFKKITVDKEAMTVVCQSGVKLGELDAEGHKHGVVVPAGHNTDTGVAGLTLGGGVGFLVRKHGLTIDNLLSVRIVLATGEIVVASGEENTDLFWGIRGGSGNFGVVTEFTYRCHSIPAQVMGGAKVYAINNLPLFSSFMASKFDILARARDYCNQAPNEVGAMFVMPAGGPIITAFCHCGTVEEGRAEFLNLNMPYTPIDTIKPVSYQMDIQKFAEGPKKDRQQSGFYFEKGLLFADLSDEALRVFENFTTTLAPRAGIEAVIAVIVLGGKMADVAPEATAFEHRGAKYWGLFMVQWWQPELREEAVQWCRKLYDTLKPFSQGNYAPVIGADEQNSGLVYTNNLARLVELKQKYDPNNLFRNNRNINPKA
eukprot:TRINITY_DN2808_c0_g1_i2.p1 TRINITY_DN2808_c0_g1~~TRINITY_DN2808_c0_g1_i2.p1  ORF type:complete len:384 (-),score=104.48 TRINITY_DN2808_c0_g1_i2:210-1361(-)